jgi:hypothetical protein
MYSAEQYNDCELWIGNSLLDYLTTLLVCTGQMRHVNDEWRVGKDLEGNGGGYFNALSWHYPKETEWSNNSQNSQEGGRDSKHVLLKQRYLQH